MPKKMLNKKLQKLVESQDLDTVIEEESHAKVFGGIEKEVILQKLNSVNYEEREGITSLIASMEMSENDETLRNKLLNMNFAKSLVEKLNDPFLGVRFNSLMAIMNILICYGNNDADVLFIRDCKLFNQMEMLLKDYISNINMKIIYSEGEKETYNKIFVLTYDLLLLIIENFGDNRDHFMTINDLIECSVYIVTNASHFSEDLIIKVCFFLANISSIKIIPFNNNFKQLYEICSKVIFENKDSNFLIRASLTCFVFYSVCYNDCLVNTFQISKIVEDIYTSFNSYDIVGDFKNLTKEIDGLDKEVKDEVGENGTQTNLIVEDEKITEKKEKLNDANIEKMKSCFKQRIKQIEEKVSGLTIYLKTLIDITNGIDSFKGKGIDKDEDDDEIYEDHIEDKNDEGARIDAYINKQVNSLFNSSNVSTIFSKNFIMRLVSNCQINLYQYIFNDYDKLVVVKELLYDFEYYSISLMNNLINNLDILKSLNDLLLEKEMYLLVVKKLSSSGLIYQNPDYISLVLTFLRNILENNKNIFEIVKEDFNYKSLLLVMNKNINDTMIKINVIDIISFVFSKVPHPAEVNEEICAVLFNFCLNETDIEVLGHVMNSFMDIWSEDDYNFVLKKLNIVEKMKIGLNDYKSRVKSAFKSRLIDDETRKYCNLAVTNIRSFIQYKEKMFQSQNLN